MDDYQQAFIHAAIEHQALSFGDFTLKSGRKSPYFFNLGQFNTGKGLQALTQAYASSFLKHTGHIDMIFGPAYKGIPIVSCLAHYLFSAHHLNMPYAFNRKEVKTHGEGGQIIGAAIKGNVAIVDDVITAGTAIRESIEIIQAHKATPAAILVALDRQERLDNHLTAIEDIEATFKIPVYPIIRLENIIHALQEIPEQQSTAKQLLSYARSS